jgi:DUF1680 family protein
VVGSFIKTQDTNGPRQVSRRDVVELAGLSALSLFLGPQSAYAADGARRPAQEFRARYAALYTLPAGDIQPAGWLGQYLQKQANELGRHLPEVSWPFDGRYWSGEETAPDKLGWWPWEQKAYWIDGTMRCALTLHDDKLLKLALQAVDYTLGHAYPDGYLGPSFARVVPKDQDDGYFRWPHTVFFRALIAYAESSGDARVAPAIARHYLADENRVPYGGPGRDVTNVEAMLWVYGQTGDKRMLAMAERAWNNFLHSAPPGDRESGDLHPARVFANTPINAHGVTYSEKAKLPAILYLYTGNSEYLRFALAAQQRIFDHHMLIDGIPSASESYRGTTALDAHETCDITDHTWAWGYLLQATGDGVWGDRIERACFNAGLGAIRKDWKAVQYFSCPNQVIATDDSSHVPYIEESKGWMAYRPNPGHETACCGGNVHRFFPNYVIRMWMSDSDGGLAAVLYGSSTVRTKVGATHEPIEIRQETNYPFDEQINLTLGLARPVAFPLWLRVPGWCQEPRLALNGAALPLPPIHRGFVHLERTFHPGDRLTLSLPMRVSMTTWPADGVGLERGPLVYSLAVTENWQPIVSARWSTREYPEWNANATSAWNYALALDTEKLDAQTSFERKTMTHDPWREPPLALTVPLKRVSGWELRAPPEHPERRQTPPLPPLTADRSQAFASARVERAQLVPYGATQLRVTIFPKA